MMVYLLFIQRDKAPRVSHCPWKSIGITGVAYISFHPLLGQKNKSCSVSEYSPWCVKDSNISLTHICPHPFTGLRSSCSLRRELSQKEELHSKEPTDV